MVGGSRAAPLAASLEAPAAARCVPPPPLVSHEVDAHYGRLETPSPPHCDAVHQRAADEKGLDDNHRVDKRRCVLAVWPEDVVEGGCRPDRCHDYGRHLGYAHYMRLDWIKCSRYPPCNTCWSLKCCSASTNRYGGGKQ